MKQLYSFGILVTTSLLLLFAKSEAQNISNGAMLRENLCGTISPKDHLVINVSNLTVMPTPKEKVENTTHWHHYQGFWCFELCHCNM